ncbi:MAG: hypothetical protein HZA51_17725 [Planctomycetes bacterium]|nr:hypothetical protein [Planctomycetota bacterium]
MARIRELGYEATGRAEKSTISIIDKLRRESVRLSQMQDIAGCRIVVSTIADQDELASKLTNVLPNATLIDRRQTPSHGYRAVHIIAEVEGFHVEIQIRTEIQHLWAEVSERLSDLVSTDIKYGGGPEECRDLLRSTSISVASCESRTSFQYLGADIERANLIQLFEQLLNELKKHKTQSP